MKQYHLCSTLSNKTFQEIDNGFNGESVSVIYKNLDGFWVATQSHYEYGSVIVFCPYCGLRLSEVRILDGAGVQEK